MLVWISTRPPVVLGYNAVPVWTFKNSNSWWDQLQGNLKE